MQKLQVCTCRRSVVCHKWVQYVYIWYTDCTHACLSVHHREGFTFADNIFRASLGCQAALEDIANIVSKSLDTLGIYIISRRVST